MDASNLENKKESLAENVCIFIFFALLVFLIYIANTSINKELETKNNVREYSKCVFAVDFINASFKPFGNEWKKYDDYDKQKMHNNCAKILKNK